MNTKLTGIIMNLLTSSLFNMHVIRSFCKDKKYLLKITLKTSKENSDIAITNISKEESVAVPLSLVSNFLQSTEPNQQICRIKNKQSADQLLACAVHKFDCCSGGFLYSTATTVKCGRRLINRQMEFCRERTTLTNRLMGRGACHFAR